MIDIHSQSTDPRAAQLSNLAPRTFTFDNVPCRSIESFLQALKEPDPDAQKNMCTWSGVHAKKSSPRFYAWKDSHTLWWQGQKISRFSAEYQALLRRHYDTVYQQDPTLRCALQATRREELRHTIGISDPRETVLTEVEFIHQLNCLRLHGRVR